MSFSSKNQELTKKSREFAAGQGILSDYEEPKLVVFQFSSEKLLELSGGAKGEFYDDTAPANEDDFGNE